MAIGIPLDGMDSKTTILPMPELCMHNQLGPVCYQHEQINIYMPFEKNTIAHDIYRGRRSICSLLYKSKILFINHFPAGIYPTLKIRYLMLFNFREQ